MKIGILLLVLVLMLSGCSPRSVSEKLEDMGDKVEDGLDKMLSTVTTATITQAQAVTIALEHAGVSQSQITGLKTEYEADSGHYDVHFLLDGQEYEYEISAKDGKILSFEMDE